ncbi:serine hydrolase domain-containing protein [Legionella dresdenensis]|uniref:Serine hydrolase domain-containing protein n=1 Tax=Legionella dresdenensis TaxID=450200 RepID=A0ABV8CHE6_9GAMM
MNKRILLIAIILQAQSCFAISPATEQAIDNIVANAMAQGNIPGLALAVMVDGKPYLKKGYGYADIEQKIPVRPGTLFGIGSVSKVITAFGLMTLVQEQKVNLDDSVLKYIPEAPRKWKTVTIRELLSHSSGIPQHYGPHLPWPKTWQQVRNLPMEFTPGTDIKYNNFGYIVLGKVIENASGQNLDDFLAQRIFAPLAMHKTGFPLSQAPAGLAVGYGVQNGQIVVRNNQRPWLQMWSSGGIVSTLGNMARWDAAMTAGQLLSAESYRQMWTPVLLLNGKPAGRKNWAWSLGWQVSYQNNKLVAEKDGAITGYSSWISRHIDDKVSIIILTNKKRTQLKRLSNQIFRQVMQQPVVR